MKVYCTKKYNKKHSLLYIKLYHKWADMKTRCYNKNCKRYESYGGRGIKVCDEWLNNPKAFYNWAINNMGTPNILTIDNITGNKLHATEKPIELMEILIKNSTNKNDVVLDPFMGCGSTGEASVKNGRNFIGCEIDEKYFTIADKILNQGVSRESLRSKPTRKVISCDNIAMSIEEFLQC